MTAIPTSLLQTLSAQSQQQDAWMGQMDDAAIAARQAQFKQYWPMVYDLAAELGVEQVDAIATHLWRLWLPFTQELIALQQKLARPIVQGILGSQGSGKSTLTAVLRELLAAAGYRSVGFSLDDLYKSFIERQQLQRHDPRLRWRGPPGTHDVEVGVDVLDKLRQSQRHRPVLVPRFDKAACGGSGDKAMPEMVDAVDIVIFEGWFVGVRPIADTVFDGELPPPIVTERDRAFARDMNQELLMYIPLWQRLDRLMVLKPVDYRLSQVWRIEAEQKMRAKGRGGMDDEEVNAFVTYFWQALHPDLFITPLTHNPQLTDWVVEITADHGVGHIYQPR